MDQRRYILTIQKAWLELFKYLRTIGYKAWIEDANGNEIEETVLKDAIK